MGIILALLAAAVITWIIITIGKLLDHLEKLKSKNNNSVTAGDVESILGPLIQQNLDKKTALDINALRKKAGKKGMFTAEVSKDGVVLKDTVTLIKSDKRDEETEELLEANEGMVYIA